jgi:splicing factor 3A subunit 2
LFAAEPYETIAFKIPKLDIDKGKFATQWHKDRCVFTLQLFFKSEAEARAAATAAATSSGARQKIAYHGRNV